MADAPVEARVVAMTGDLRHACRAPEIRDRLAAFTVVEQRGDDFAARLVNAHADAAAATGRPVPQIGMDATQVSPALLTDCARALLSAPAVLGMASDGGWWVLGVAEPATAKCLLDVPMSSIDTGAVTLRACSTLRVGNTCAGLRMSTPSTTSWRSATDAGRSVGLLPLLAKAGV